MSYTIIADPEQVEKDFEKFLEAMPPELRQFVDPTAEKFMYGAFLAGYHRGMSKTLAEIEKKIKNHDKK